MFWINRRGVFRIGMRIWNAYIDWSSFNYWAGYSQNHSGGGTPPDFLTNQILVTNPFTVAIWCTGLVSFVFLGNSFAQCDAL